MGLRDGIVYFDDSRNCNLSPSLLYHFYWGLGLTGYEIANITPWSDSSIYRQMERTGMNEFSDGNITHKSKEQIENSVEVFKKYYKTHPEHNKGKNNPFYGKSHTDKTKNKISVSNKGNTGFWNKGLTKETDERLEESARKLSETRKRLIANGEIDVRLYVKNNVPTLPEIKFMEIVKENNLSYEYNGQGQKLTISGRVPDFVDIENRNLVEIFGVVFHDPEKAFFEVPYYKTYEGTMEHYRENDYDCVIIWDYEVDDVDLVLEKLGVV